MLNIPPGLEYLITGSTILDPFTSGGDSQNWLPYTQVKQYTNAFVFKDSKARTPSVSCVCIIDVETTSGGKVDHGETSLQAAARELQEECGITAPLVHTGTLFFVLEGEEWVLHAEVYRADTYQGIVTESEEMRPEWFSTRTGDEGKVGEPPALPFAQMWESDVVFFPLLLSKQTFVGRADFIRDGVEFKLHKWWYATVPAT
ncbi:7,8-dihydro-8-oxoguanine triphosphatase [Psilocybe cubensis]|uniref:Nudix hydrolase domain-containing protein n=2 Tax=Psilocybe cubensis TaxID=181762 RepID=A0A8H8CG25_PSICU|nr:7,8-dihydro-8-oxoguanine triphosphatase [Psilocybe cubensis]KAH9477515.1 7,8-dihydro-8-oxoguanine triphosphatase [Psilocybe cubensis]